MKKLSKILIVLLALTLAFALAVPVFADGAPDEGSTTTTGSDDTTTTGSDDTTTTGSDDTLTTGADDTTTGETTGTAVTVPNNYSIGLFVLDGDGNRVTNSGAMSCLGSSVNLFIKHDYQIVAKYYNQSGEVIETDDVLILEVMDESGNAELGHNVIKLKAADDAYTFKLRVVDPSAEDGATTYTLEVKRFNFDLPDLVVAAVAVYVIVSAIRGTGSLFSDEFIKEDKKKLFKTLTRALSFVTGIMFIAAAVLSSCFSYLDWVSTVRYVLFGVGALCLIGMVVINYVFTDKEKRDKARQTAGTGGGNASRAAFEFDGTEPTIDDVLNDLKNKENKE